ncbi:MAG: farnesyl-diphosphate synthase [Alphaproteobacteria bacterium]|nr:MAG: farnesyl-diphosphate synthase [Alphaproteobacteria bacterium]
MNLKFKNFQNTLLKNSEEVDSFIKKNLPRNEGLNKKLIQAIKYSILGSGKKIRSFLVIEVGKVVSDINKLTFNKKKKDELIVIASAIEAIHTYSLIHDDLPAMDNSDYRRGKKSTHKKFDEATAILAGDALQSWGFELISNPRNFENRDKISKLVFELSKAIGFCGMVGGQQGDIDFTHNDLSEDNILWIQQKKTGSLLECCVTLSSIICNAKDDQIIKLQNFSRNLGLAFQIKDDLLDLNSNSKELGKPVHQDQSNETPNFVNYYGEEKSIQKMNDSLEKSIESLNIFGNHAKNLVLLADYIVKRSH